VRKNYPFEIPEIVAGRDAVLLADHVKSLDWRTRHAAFIEKADARLLLKTRAYLAVLLSMTTPH
jgi:mRNA-degrading endonuclease toxin of MazEF toxin-antitoxin module